MSASESPVLQGVPVVPGVRFAPVIRANRLPDISQLDPGGQLGEADRAAEVERFTAAAATVAARLREKAAAASGPAAEVLTATAQLAQDRAWLGSAENAIKAGKPAVRATAEAAAQFIEMFTKMGGLMAERVTDLKDIRDRVIAELAGLPAPGVPDPVEPSILFAEDLAPADTAGLDPHRIVGLATSPGNSVSPAWWPSRASTKSPPGPWC
jgi:phosphotransferase system enzyme I (PtsI)